MAEQLTSCTKSCGTWTPQAADKSGYAPVASIPCRPDLRLGDIAGMMSQGVGQVKQSAGIFAQMVMQNILSKGKS
ncbi:hypothetical protein ABLA30_05505 [Xenorhabdus nematophila]|uniref:hypothetical protein n=1 Tax=Xenorhabdus nematophila TaxID=628 RepID=UPI0032B829E0